MCESINKELDESQMHLCPVLVTSHQYRPKETGIEDQPRIFFIVPFLLTPTESCICLQRKYLLCNPDKISLSGSFRRGAHIQFGGITCRQYMLRMRRRFIGWPWRVKVLKGGEILHAVQDGKIPFKSISEVLQQSIV